MYGLHEDDELIELQSIKEVNKLSILLVLFERHKILLEPKYQLDQMRIFAFSIPVESELSTIVDVDLKWLYNHMLVVYPPACAVELYHNFEEDERANGKGESWLEVCKIATIFGFDKL